MVIPTKDFTECFEQWKRHWENCVRSQGAYFEGDGGVIVLCTVFLVSCINFNKCLFHSAWMDTFWTYLAYIAKQTMIMSSQKDHTLKLYSICVFSGDLADSLHSVPVAQMGNYQEYLKTLASPLREIDPDQPKRLHTFGNPFKQDKKVGYLSLCLPKLCYFCYNSFLLGKININKRFSCLFKRSKLTPGLFVNRKWESPGVGLFWLKKIIGDVY